MNNSFKKTSNKDVSEIEIFEDSCFLANFEDTSFKDSISKFHDSVINHSIDKSALNVSALCCDEELNGYDKLTGKTWIYPTNYPVRDYQFNIINAALLKNTLVSLPTGLGKTFIAAVIMYNFYRWYPTGKIVFTAPTRPLVAQQIDACYNIIAIPPNDTIEMTGHMQATTRKAHWQSKRVFFATPQVIYNDIKSGICPGDKIRCLVIDEAHRARGNYAYCQIVSTLTSLGNKTYRLLALSATPGSKVDDVINVVKTLLISHLELRTENCIDVAPYSHSRKINTVIVQLGPELSHLRQQYVEILDDYARRLKQLNILPHNVGNLSKGRIVMLYKEYQTKDRGARHPQHNFIMKDFTLLIALYHGLELLVKHGSRVFLNFFDEHPEKSWIQSDDRLTALLERLRDDLGINPLSLNTSILPNGTIPEIPQNVSFGHPKFYKLKEIMMDHFNRSKQKGQNTKAIVFCEYRESVNLVHCLLLQCRPLIMPQMFVGQGASGKDGKAAVSQKQQLRVMQAFRAGVCNVLVATCVAEEGLDVGSVDLILCFDISTRSPVRLVQRCGRTGRERGGQVHILVTEGREHQTLMDCMRQRDGLNNRILHSKEVENNLYKSNPRMVPRDFTPVCKKMYITVANKPNEKHKETVDKVKKGQKDLRSMLGRASSSDSSNKDTDNMISEIEFKQLFPNGFLVEKTFEDPKEFCLMTKELFEESINKTDKSKSINLSTWLEWQRALQNTINIEHSENSKMLSDLLQYSDAKRFDLPVSTQYPSFSTQQLETQNLVIPSPVKAKQPAKKKQKIFSKSPVKRKSPIKKPASAKPSGKKDADIRALFSTATKSTKNYTKLINDLGIQNNDSIPTKLINLFVDLNMNCTENVRRCYICENIFDCKIVENIQEKRISRQTFSFLTDLKLPDLNKIDDFSEETILSCRNTNCYVEMSDLGVKSELDTKMHVSSNFDLEFDFDSPMDINSPILSPKSNKDTKNFDIGDFEDIFAESILKIKDEEIEKNESDPKAALGFFGLQSIDDIFADEDSIENDEVKTDVSYQKTPSKDKSDSNNQDKKSPILELQRSPSILTGRVNVNVSPILCSQPKKMSLSLKNRQVYNSTPASSTKKQLFQEPITHLAKNENTLQQSKNQNISTDKSMLSITQLVDIINKSEDKPVSTISNTTEHKAHISNPCERSPSPIILTQADRKKSNSSVSDFFKNNDSEKPDSLIILSSGSDSDDTQPYDVANTSINLGKDDAILDDDDFVETPVRIKRKFDHNEQADDASPYFNKKPKLENNETKYKTLQERVKKFLINKNNSVEKSPKNQSQINFMICPNHFNISKENLIDSKKTVIDDENEEYVKKNNLEMLQMFKRGSLVISPKKKLEEFLNSPRKTKIIKQNRRIDFDDSDDDDFVNFKKIKPSQHHNKENIPKHKTRKKKSDRNGFLELEAELSADEDSGDELSDDSVGSIIDFICDDNTHVPDDMHAEYLKSVKSPVNGMFKIPQLPRMYDHEEVFSQFVAEDSYEMDSFCVDSHVGLTQTHDVSELELAEMMLENKRRLKKNKIKPNPAQENEESPVIRRKPVKRKIESDSDDSS